MPGRTGSGIAAGDRPAGAWGSRFCSACPARVRRAKLGGPRVLDAVRPRAWHNGKAEGKPRILPASHVGRPARLPAPRKITWKKDLEDPARGDRAGLVVGSLLPVPAAGPGPDEGVALAFLVGEQVGEDRGGEGGIIQLQAQIGAPFIGTAGPGRTEFNPAQLDAVVGGVIVGTVGFGHQPDVAGLQGQGDDFAFEAFAHLLEGTDVSHCRISMLLSGRDHRGLDGDRPAGGERQSTLQGRSAAEDGRAGTFLSREEWRRSRQGKKVQERRCGQPIEAQPVFG